MARITRTNYYVNEGSFVNVSGTMIANYDHQRWIISWIEISEMKIDKMMINLVGNPTRFYGN